jgi:hypothetical protein
MDRGGLRGVHRALFVHGLTENVEDPTQGGLTDGYGDGSPGVEGFHAAHQAVGAAHGHGTHPVIAQQLLHFGRQGHVLACGVLRLDAQGVVDLGQLAGREFNVEHRADHLPNDAFGAGGGSSSHV